MTTKAPRAAVTVGVDVANKDARTALRAVRGEPNGAVVEHLVMNIADATIVDHTGDAGVVALDAPFGWPQRMAEAVSA